jgi:hypothetical protein
MRRTGSLTCTVALGLILSTSVSTALAQIQNGQISGQVVDASGAAIPGAHLRVWNDATGYHLDIETNASGLYTAAELLAGNYNVRVEAPTFKAAAATSLRVESGTVLRADFTMSIGPPSETVEVGDVSATVDTVTSQLSSEVDVRQIEDLPLNGRNVYDLVQYQPGATNVRGVMYENGANTVVNGIRENFNGFLLNGADNKGLSGGFVSQPILDTVEAVQVLTLNNAPELGDSAGAITDLITKSGSNLFHGSVWEFLRNDIFDANPFYSNHFANPADRKRAPLRLNQYGATLSGPIRKNKSFFLIAFQGDRFVESSPLIALTESPQFSAATISAFPNSVAALLYTKFPAKGPSTPSLTLRQYVNQNFGSGFMTFGDYLCPANTDGATSHAGEISRKFAALFGVEQADITEMNARCPGGSPYSVPQAGTFNRDTEFLQKTLNTQGSQQDGSLFNGNEASFRFDENFNERNRMFSQFNWSHADDRLSGTNAVRGITSPSTATAVNFQFSLIHLFSQSMLNEFQAGYVQNASAIVIDTPGLPGIDDGTLGFGAGQPSVVHEHIYSYGDTLSLLYGKHNVKFGGKLRHDMENSEIGAGIPTYSFFDPLFFAIDAPYAQNVGVDPGFTTGAPAQLADNVRHWRDWEVGGFVEDGWKISRHFMLNVGLRYDLHTGDKELDRLATTFIRGPGTNIIDNITTGAGQIKNASTPCPDDPKAVLAGECGPGGFAPANSLGGGNHNNFGPSIGFAWDVFGNGKTSLRGSFAIRYEGSLQKRLSLTRWNPPYYSLNTITNFLDSNPDGNIVYGPVAGGTPTVLGPAPVGQHSGVGLQATGNIAGWDPSNPQTADLTSIVFSNGVNDPVIHNWFFGIQRELRPKLRVELNYVGTTGSNLFRAESVNRIPGSRLPEGTCVTDNFGRRICSQRNTNKINNYLVNPSGRFLNPNFGRLRVWENTATSSYHSMQLSVSQQLNRGFRISANYTYAHSIDDGSTWQSGFSSVNGPAAGDGVTTDQTQPQLDRGNSEFDIRHRVAGTYTWELPFFQRERSRFASVLRGWELNGILSAQTGAHWSPYNPNPALLQGNFPGACNAATFNAANCVNIGGDYNLDGEANDRPNAIANALHATHAQWADGFNLPANFFSAPCLGCIGNLGRNTFVGPSYWDADVSLLKTFSITESVHVQFRMEAFNVFNHTNFLIGVNDITSPLFGMSGGTQPPRNLQFGLKLKF